MGRTVVIGVGNPYRSDDGVGPAVVELLRDKDIPGVELECALGETAELIELWTGATVAFVVDAVRAQPAHPGRVHHLVPDFAPPRAASSHGPGLGEAVELARALGRLPGRLELFAVEVERVGHGQGLSVPVAAAARHVVEAISAILAVP
jgi:hydrogenase maturation protease